MKPLLCLLILLLAAICWQDMKYRAVDWIFFPAAFLLTLANAWAGGAFSVQGVLLNLLLLLIQLAGLQVYISYKKGGWLMAGERYMGWGDVLFFLVLAVSFSPLNFVAFQLGSLLLILLVTLILHVAGLRVRQVPLAGGQALLLALLLAADFTNKGSSLYADHVFIDLVLYGKD